MTISGYIMKLRKKDVISAYFLKEVAKEVAAPLKKTH